MINYSCNKLRNKNVKKKKKKKSSYLDGIGQGERDGKRKALRNGDDEHSNTDDQKLDKVVKVLGAPVLSVLVKLAKAESHDQNDDGEYGYSGTWVQTIVALIDYSQEEGKRKQTIPA